jgi:dephospho-CoA kinase
MVLFDIPLLFEKSYENECDFIVVVSAPPDVQRKRVMSRLGMTEKRFQYILNNQMPDAEKREKADFIIQTDKGFEYAREQVQKVINDIRNDANA